MDSFTGDDFRAPKDGGQYSQVDESLRTSKDYGGCQCKGCPQCLRTWQAITGFVALGVVAVASIAAGIALRGKSRAAHYDARDIAVVYPLVANTWPWKQATSAGHAVLYSPSPSSNSTARTLRRLDGLVACLESCEERKCDHTVGQDGSPDSLGAVSLDAMVMDGPTWDSGAVGFLQHSERAAAVARDVMIYTSESILSGAGADRFAELMGYPRRANLTGQWAADAHAGWLAGGCQPNFWRRVRGWEGCGPYDPVPGALPGGDYRADEPPPASEAGSAGVPAARIRDTISAIAVDEAGDVSVGTSSNGARNKIHGRVGDAPIAGAGAFVDNEVGAAVATGDGDVMMRFAPAALAVEKMRAGASATQACEQTMGRIGAVFPRFAGGMVCFNKLRRTIGGAGFGWGFTYAYQSGNGTAAVASPPRVGGEQAM